jgi:hypothetical protein
VAAEVHFTEGTIRLRALYQFGGVVVRDSRPDYLARQGWSLRKVYVDPERFEDIRYALACAGIAELRQKGAPRLGVRQVVETLMVRRRADPRLSARNSSLWYADALA